MTFTVSSFFFLCIVKPCILLNSSTSALLIFKSDLMLENCKSLNLATRLAASLSQKKVFQLLASLSGKSLFSRPTLFLAQLLLLSGNVELNPGPPTKYPCGEFSRPCKRSQPILCHQKCVQMNTDILQALGDYFFTLICWNCSIPNFSSNSFDPSTSLESNNPFSSL